MRILFVGMANSIHLSRWIAQLSDQGWDIHIFPVDNLAEKTLRQVTLHDVIFYLPKTTLQALDSSVKLDGLYWTSLKQIWRLPKIGPRLGQRVLRRLRPQWPTRAWRLAQTIRRIKPDIVHSLEIQHAGYLTNYARAIYGTGFPKWIVSNWGSDIYLFGRLHEHIPQIKAVLSACDYYHCECQRDVEIARQFGFEKEVLPILPVAGGHNVKHMRRLREPISTSAKRLIVLKGYQNWAGRALVGLRAIELCADLLHNYRVAINLATVDVIMAAELISERTGIPISVVPYGPHDDILRLHGRARISIGLSISDGISTSLLEAMIMGSFPIQSHTGCGNEWIEDGRSGFLVPPEDPIAVADAIRRAVMDDQLVDCATEINDKIIDERLDISVIKPQAIAMYQYIGEQLGPLATP
jgi:glycosyltransferase involved in cell wall biosynthesis